MLRCRPATASRAEIPTSSMADIAFLLIIFFMITAVFALNRGLDMTLDPRERDRPDADPDPAVLIHVFQDRVEVDCQAVERDGLLPYLESKLALHPMKPVILYTDPEATYDRMIDVYDRLAETTEPGSPWSFSIEQLSVPTRRDIESYVRSFGVNPMEAACSR